MNNPLEQAIEIAEGQTALAKRLRELIPGSKVQQGHISNWLTRSNGVPPPEYCAPIEMITDGKVTRQQFYPNDYQRIWPELGSSV